MRRTNFANIAEGNSPFANPTFTTENVVYRPDRYFSKVVGVVGNPLDKDVKQVLFTVIGYDAAGVIIGAGYTFLSFTPANGKTTAEASALSMGPL